jgi:hypothetical protein
VLLEVGDQLGEDRLELLQGGGHVGGMAGPVGGLESCYSLAAGYEARKSGVVLD